MVKVMNVRTKQIIEVPQEHWDMVLAPQGKYVLHPVELVITVEEKEGELITKDIKVKSGKHLPTISK